MLFCYLLNLFLFRIDIVHDDDDYLVVDKPPSIPVHPCGRYRLVYIFYIHMLLKNVQHETQCPGITNLYKQ